LCHNRITDRVCRSRRLATQEINVFHGIRLTPLTVVNVVAVPNASTLILSTVVANPASIHSVRGEHDCIGRRGSFCEHNSNFADSASNRISAIASVLKHFYPTRFAL